MFIAMDAAAPLPAVPRLTVPLEVYYFDTDAGVVVHNIAYLRMIEIARSQLAASLGWTLEEMNRTGLVPVVARTEIDYLRPAPRRFAAHHRRTPAPGKNPLLHRLRNHLRRQARPRFRPLRADHGHRATPRRPAPARPASVGRR